MNDPAEEPLWGSNPFSAANTTFTLHLKPRGGDLKVMWGQSPVCLLTWLSLGSYQPGSGISLHSFSLGDAAYGGETQSKHHAILGSTPA